MNRIETLLLRLGTFLTLIPSTYMDLRVKEARFLTIVQDFQFPQLHSFLEDRSLNKKQSQKVSY